jgi:hypothetical protein
VPYPYTRLRTYLDSSPIIPGDLNTMQDGGIVAAHGSIPWQFAPYAWLPGSNVSRSGAGYLEWTNVGEAYLSPQLRAGDLVEELELRVYGNGAADFAINAWLIDEDMVLTNVCPGAAAFDILDPGAAWATATIPLTRAGNPLILAEGEALWIAAAGSTGGLRLGNSKLWVSHPLP